MMLTRDVFIFAVCFLCSADLLAYNKCVSDDGRITFQDEPCSKKRKKFIDPSPQMPEEAKPSESVSPTTLAPATPSTSPSGTRTQRTPPITQPANRSDVPANASKVPAPSAAKPAKETFVAPSDEGDTNNTSASASFVEISIPNRKAIMVPVPPGWEVNVSALDNNKIRTLRAMTHKGDPVVLLASPMLIDANNRDEEIQQFHKIRTQIKTQYLTNPYAREISSGPVKMNRLGAAGFTYTFIDESLAKLPQLSDGEYIYVSSSVFALDRTLIVVTLLTDNIESQNYRSALAGLAFIADR